MERKKKTLIGLLLMLVLSCFVVFATACNHDKENGVDGTYYLYSDGSYVMDSYYILSGTTWSDNDKLSGTIVLNGENITLYMDFFGSNEEVASGTVKDGVLILNIGDCEIFYCKEGVSPDDGSHTHTYSDDWSSNATYHWHAATCEHTELHTDREPNSFLNNTCIICGYVGEAQTVKFTVTFDAGAGKFADELSKKRVRVDENSLITAAETPVRAGYNFGGWYFDDTYETEWNLQTERVVETVTLYAKWTRIEQNVTLNLNYDGGSIQVMPTQDGKITFIPERTGYVFNGWWKGNSSSSGITLTEKIDISKEITESGLVLYADWIEESIAAKKLLTPSVTFVNGTLSWLAIEDASSYNLIISYNNEELYNNDLSSTSYSFSSYWDAGNYSVQLRANGDGINTINSSYTSVRFYYKVLAQVTDISLDISTSILSWYPVENATEYELYIDDMDEPVITERNTLRYDMSDYESGQHQIKIIASRSGYSQSSKTVSVVKYRLLSPENFQKLAKNTGENVIVWDEVRNADAYIVTIGTETIRVNSAKVEIPNTETYWKGEFARTVTIQAVNSDNDYLLSLPSQTINISKKFKLEINDTVENNTGYRITSGDNNLGIYAAESSYTVSFNLNGGTGSIVSQTITDITAMTYPTTIPTRSGYVFTGWYTTSSCTTLFDFTSNISQDTTVYAGWYAMITSGYGSYAINVLSNYNSSSTAYSAENTSSYKYHYFTALTDGTYRIYYKNSSSSSSYGTNFYAYNATQSTTIKSSANCYSTTYNYVEFSANAGDVIYIRTNRPNYTATYSFYVTGAAYPETVWDGWYENGVRVSTDLVYTFDMPSANINLTAKWNCYTIQATATEGGKVKINNMVAAPNISFDMNGGTGSIASQTITTTTAMTYPTTIPTRSGYVFTGWYTTSSCTTLFDFTSNISQDTTVYAGWVAYSGDGILSQNGSIQDTFPNRNSTSKKYYAFVPLVSGSITIYSSGSSDTYGYLYNSTKSEITHDDDSGSGNNFSITYNVTAGNLYYIAPCGYGGSVTMTVYMTGATYPAAGGSAIDEFKIAVGQTVNLTAETLDGYIFLGWYDGNVLVSYDLVYSYVMTAENKHFTAKWEVNPNV